jgi:phage FluMu protein Com
MRPKAEALGYLDAKTTIPRCRDNNTWMQRQEYPGAKTRVPRCKDNNTQVAGTTILAVEAATKT